MKPMWAARSREHMVDAPAARKRRSRLLWSAGAVVPGAYGWAVSPMPALSRCTASSRPPSQLELNYSPTPGRVTEVSKASVTCTGRCTSEPRTSTPPRSCHACIGSLLCSNDGCWRSTRAGSGPTRSTTTSTNSPSASIGVTRAPVACSSTDCFTKPSGLRLTHTAHSSAAASTDPPPAPIAPESRSSGHCNEGDSPTGANGWIGWLAVDARALGVVQRLPGHASPDPRAEDVDLDWGIDGNLRRNVCVGDRLPDGVAVPPARHATGDLATDPHRL